jgi:hypothetical protein
MFGLHSLSIRQYSSVFSTIKKKSLKLAGMEACCFKKRRVAPLSISYQISYYYEHEYIKFIFLFKLVITGVIFGQGKITPIRLTLDLESSGYLSLDGDSEKYVGLVV